MDMDDLYGFDGNNKPDRVDRITVDYRRVTKIKPKVIPEDASWEYETWYKMSRLNVQKILYKNVQLICGF